MVSSQYSGPVCAWKQSQQSPDQCMHAQTHSQMIRGTHCTGILYKETTMKDKIIIIIAMKVLIRWGASRHLRETGFKNHTSQV